MSFNPNTDVNFATYNSTVAGLDGNIRGNFDAFLIRELCLQSTLGTTLSNTEFNTMVTAALESAKLGVYQF